MPLNLAPEDQTKTVSHMAEIMCQISDLQRCEFRWGGGGRKETAVQCGVRFRVILESVTVLK
jgi:hypothetical protein